MRPNRHVPTHGVINHHLPCRIVQMVVAPDRMGYAHVVVIHHHGQHIDRRAVRAQQHHVVQLVVVNCHIALDLVAYHRGSVLRRLDPHHIGRIRMRRRVSIAPGRPVERAFSLGARGFPKCGNFVLRGETFIRLALRQQLVSNLCMPVGAGKLADRFAVPIQTQPSQPLQNRPCRFGRGAFPVGIFNPQ